MKIAKVVFNAKGPFVPRFSCSFIPVKWRLGILALGVGLTLGGCRGEGPSTDGASGSAGASPMEARLQAQAPAPGSLGASGSALAATTDDRQKEQEFVTIQNEILKSHSQWKQLSSGQKVHAVARYFVNKGDRIYVPGLLGGGPKENPLFTDFKRFDCVLYVETVLALASTLGSSGTWSQFKQALQHLRYRGGELGYLTRLHYSSEWLLRASERGILKNLGGPNVDARPVTLVSQILAQQKRSDAMAMAQIEKNQVPQQRRYFTCGSLQQALVTNAGLVQEGDVVLFTAKVPAGLDVNHLGILSKMADGKTWGFFNAHGPHGVSKVILEADSLASYCPKYNNSGVMLARPVFQ